MEGHFGCGISCSSNGAAAVVEQEAAFCWRKGPWTAEEDKLLIEYVKLHGEGRWNSVSRLTGLKRNGKSCRLRWVNYLRPDLKRGHITPQEETIIVELHARWGNRWSTIARSLPGRTDNEIKNYWRTHFKKKTKVPLLDASQKARNRLLKRQQFHQQQKEQLNQLDMKKRISLLDDDTNNDDNYHVAQFSGRQEAAAAANSSSSSSSSNGSVYTDSGEEHRIFFGNDMLQAAEEGSLWDDEGLWSLEEYFHAAAGRVPANLVAPNFC
ncbi:unnamed protein product [Linum tenue]|uniref:Uncharacterized protein n=1 Tax=Linum tenue TaxID=586396 RepID=A0AAV0LRM5_9ROSI|nr:unnamed protein product [Linum tenue]